MSYPLSKWWIVLQSDETLNDSDKTFTVPTNTQWHVLWIWVEYTSTAVVGNRQLVVEIQDAAADVSAQPARARVVQAAGLTYNYMFGPSLAQDLAVYDTDYICTPIPPTLILESGHIVRVYDNNAVDAVADDMVVHMQVAARAMV